MRIIAIVLSLAFLSLSTNVTIQPAQAKRKRWKKFKKRVKRAVRSAGKTIKATIKRPRCAVLTTKEGILLTVKVKELKKRRLLRSKSQCMDRAHLARLIASQFSWKAGVAVRLYGECACHRAF